MKPRIAILAVLLLAFYLRVVGLTVAPPGLYFDEAAHGLDALRVWQGHLKIFFPTANGHEPLFTYLVALFVGWITACLPFVYLRPSQERYRLPPVMPWANGCSVPGKRYWQVGCWPSPFGLFL